MHVDSMPRMILPFEANLLPELNWPACHECIAPYNAIRRIQYTSAPTELQVFGKINQIPCTYPFTINHSLLETRRTLIRTNNTVYISGATERPRDR